jgi:hypothetical protein
MSGFGFSRYLGGVLGDPFILEDGTINPASLDGTGKVRVATAYPDSIGFSSITPDKDNYVFGQNFEVQGGIINHTVNGGASRNWSGGTFDEQVGALYWDITSDNGAYGRSYISLNDDGTSGVGAQHFYVAVNGSGGANHKARIDMRDLLAANMEGDFQIQAGGQAVFRAVKNGVLYSQGGSAGPSVILTGLNSTVNANITNSVILGGDGVTADKNDYAFAENLEIQAGIGLYTVDPTTNGSWGDRAIPDKKYVDDSAGVTATLQTPGDTQTDIDTLALASDTTVIFTAYVVGTETATGDTLAMEVSGAAKNDGGVASIVDAVTESRVAEDAGASAWSVTADVNGTDLRIRVTGEASHTIEWASKLYYNTVSF